MVCNSGMTFPQVTASGGFAVNQAYLFVRVGLVAVATASFVGNQADCPAWARNWSSWLLPETLWFGGGEFRRLPLWDSGWRLAGKSHLGN
jgi:hypothetical protein